MRKAVKGLTSVDMDLSKFLVLFEFLSFKGISYTAMGKITSTLVQCQSHTEALHMDHDGCALFRFYLTEFVGPRQILFSLEIKQKLRDYHVASRFTDVP